MSKEESPIIRMGKFLSNEPRVVYVMLFVISFAGALAPFEMPANPSSWTVRLFNEIEKMGPGDILLFNRGTGASMLSANMPGIYAVFRQVWSRGGCVVVQAASSEVQQVMTMECWLPLLNLTLGHQVNESPLYGKQFVDLGVFPSSAAVMYSMARDFRKVVSKDTFGTSFDKIPAMKKVKSALDIKVVFVITSGGPPACWNNPIGAYYLEYGVPVVAVGEGECLTEAAFLLQGNVLKGAAFTISGQREYEAMVAAKYGMPKSIKQGYKYGAQILYLGLFVMIGMIAHNIYELVYKPRRGG